VIFLLDEIAAQKTVLASDAVLQKRAVAAVIAILDPEEMVASHAVDTLVTELRMLDVRAIDTSKIVFHDVGVVALLARIRIEHHVTVLVIGSVIDE